MDAGVKWGCALKKAKAFNFLVLIVLWLVYVFAIVFSGYDPEIMVASFILLLGFVQLSEFSFGPFWGQKFLFTLPFTCLCLVGVMVFGIWTFVFSESLLEIRVAALMSLVSLFILIGVLHEALDQEN